jgi:hypothetical protein
LERSIVGQNEDPKGCRELEATKEICKEEEATLEEGHYSEEEDKQGNKHAMRRAS